MNRAEFSRLVAVETIGPTPSERCVEATPEERVALARRLGIPEVLALTARFILHRDRPQQVIFAEAVLSARVVQTCVVSLDEFAAEIRDAFSVRFVPAGSERQSLDIGEPDEIPYEGGHLDLGEATAEQLALVLDPFPRKPGATLPGGSEDDPTASNALEALRGRH